MMRAGSLRVLGGTAFLAAALACAPPEDVTRAAGSSTVYPFSRTAAEHYAAKFRVRAPVVEAIGTGGGFQRFCEAPGRIDVVNASRAIKESERALCASAGVADVVEFAFGYDGVVLAAGRDNPLRGLTLEQLYRGLARDLPDGDGGFTPNPHRLWSDVDPDLPAVEIEVHGPPPTSGTRDAFAELALVAGASRIAPLAALEDSDADAFAARAAALREDGAWIDEGENDNAIIQTIARSRHALGVFGYSFYDQNLDALNGVAVDGVGPGFETIADGRYPLARSLYFYVDAANVDRPTADYVREFVSEAAIGPYGYLIAKGLIPLPEARRREIRAKAAEFGAEAGT